MVTLEHRDVALLADDRGVTAVDVIQDDGVGRAQREQDDVLAAVLRHVHAHRVVGVEHRGAALAHGLGHDGLDLGELVEVADVLQAKVVGLHVEHDADVGGLVAEARAQDAASGRLQHGAVHERVAQHDLRRVRAAHVALGDEVAAHVDAVGGRHADAAAGVLHDVGDEPHRRRLAVGAGDGDDADVVRRAGREQHVDDGPRHVARRALRRGQVHAQPRRRVDLDHGAADLLDRLLQRRRDDVDAGDVQADDAGDALGHEAVGLVHRVGHVDGRAAGREVRGELEPEDLAVRQHRLRRVAGPLQQVGRHVRGREPGHHLLVAVAAPRVAVLDAR